MPTYRQRKYSLTPRQAEVLRELARGHERGAIAELLGIAPATVAFHVSRLYFVFQTRSLGRMVGAAITIGILSGWPLELTGLLDIGPDIDLGA